MTIDQQIDAILVREGWPKYTNRSTDRGGPTKGGITLETLRAWRKSRSITADDVKNLQESEVRAIYEFEYLRRWKFDLIADDWVREFVVDTGVLQGQETAAKMLQAVLGVPQDGKIGPTTIKTLNSALDDQPRLKKRLIRARMHLLLDVMVLDQSIVERQTTQLANRHGWWNRVADFM